MVLTGRAGPGCLTVTEKDDEEAYGKAEPLREAPYGEGRSLREGPVLTERAGVPYGSLHKEGRRRGLRPLREGKIPYGEEPLRERKVLKARVACIRSQGLGSYSSISSGTRRAVRQHHWKVLGLLARLSLALEPAALSAATLAAGKCGARGSLSLGFRV